MQIQNSADVLAAIADFRPFFACHCLWPC